LPPLQGTDETFIDLADITRGLDSTRRYEDQSPEITDQDEALLALAVKHELGHGICQERDKLRADDYGRELRETRSVDCN